MKLTHSAGGIVINPFGQILIVSQRGKSWSLPKGHLNKKETHLAAAKREIHEETGVTELTLIQELGSYQRHKLSKNNGEDPKELKTITLFLFTTTQRALSPLDPKHPEAIWADRETIIDLLTHPKDKEFFSTVLEKLPAKAQCNA